MYKRDIFLPGNKSFINTRRRIIPYMLALVLVLVLIQGKANFQLWIIIYYLL
jgi:hypothetical protein